jgi:TolA-binding protein
LVLASAARLHAARGDDARAVPLWRAVLERHPAAAEAPEAELEWARALRRGGDAAAALARLEHLILTYPASALVPQARRELELARATVPPTP